MAIDLLNKVEDGISVSVRLTPKAAKDNLDRVDHDEHGRPRLRATVTAVPENGKANAALIKLLSKKLRLPKTAIQLIAGDQNRNKTILFAGAPDELINALDAKLRELGLLG
ncbi:MAG: DUF167 domain-containing protein [Alphaproteobacteria bacterium]|nr:DUF167 domain-containing protein [Alphaproteobacteria bacterium]